MVPFNIIRPAPVCAALLIIFPLNERLFPPSARVPLSKFKSPIKGMLVSEPAKLKVDKVFLFTVRPPMPATPTVPLIVNV